MGEYADLILMGVYCESCGCFTGEEPGHPILCSGCDKEASNADIESVFERGEEI